MNLRDLKYLIAVSETRHFGKAAERCFVSQPTLSGQIKKLEEELGVTLFERTNRSVSVTPIGEEIINHSKPSTNWRAPPATRWPARCGWGRFPPSAPI